MTAGDGVTPEQLERRRRNVSDYFRLERWEVPDQEMPGGSWFGGRTPVDDHLRDARGRLRTGALLATLDSLGGMTCGLAVLPRWIVTTSLMITVAPGPQTGPLRLSSQVLRRGRHTVVAGLEAVDEGAADAHVASATMTCTVLDPGELSLKFKRPVVGAMPPPPEDPVPLETFFRIAPGTGSSTRLELAEHLRNPWGILHGGAAATLVESAACRAAADVGVVDPAAGDTAVHYLAPIRVGPVEARCRVLGTTGGRTVVRVEVHDLGADDRLVTLASVCVGGI